MLNRTESKEHEEAELLSPAEFAALRGYSEAVVRKLCRAGRLSGARKDRRGYWKIPEDARVLDTRKARRREARSRAGEWLSVAEFAKERGVSTTRIYQLLKEERIEGAKRAKLGRSQGGAWDIPKNAAVSGEATREGLSQAEFARALGVSRQRVYQLLKAGRVEGARETAHGWDIPVDARVLPSSAMAAKPGPRPRGIPERLRWAEEADRAQWAKKMAE